MPRPIQLSKQQARRFLLAHHQLLPPRRLRGKQGVMDYVRHVNCIQYDPINVVGANPHLVLQARVRGYRPEMLENLLYRERVLVDGFDKVMSIYPVEDWPYFARHRKRLPKRYYENGLAAEAVKLMERVRAELEARGPLSSLDLEEDERIDWWWGNHARAARVALDILFLAGEIVVHHRVGTRRYFELAERALREGYYGSGDPHASIDAYQDWHVQRRVGGLGLAHPGAGEHWGGMLGMKSGERRTALKRLVEDGALVQAQVEGLENKELYMRNSDLPLLDKVSGEQQPKAGAAILGALDNLMWDRKLVRMVFDFDYVWEVYKPAAQRKYGYYVLPVVYGEAFIGRFDPAFDREGKVLTIQKWWWEAGADIGDEAMLGALGACFRDFGDYLGAVEIVLGEAAGKDKVLREAVKF